MAMGIDLDVVDNNGQIIWADQQMMLYSKDVLSRNKGAKIIFDVKCTSQLPKVISENGGKPIMSRTGHSFIKNKLKETKQNWLEKCQDIYSLRSAGMDLMMLFILEQGY